MTTRIWRWLAPHARRAALLDHAQAASWQLIADRPRTHHGARELRWRTRDGALVGWLEFHQEAVRALWFEAPATPVADALATALAELAPTWSEDPLQRQAHADDLRERLPAVRTWVLAIVVEGRSDPAMIEALAALARHEHPVARLCAQSLGFLAILGHHEPIASLADERAAADPDYADEWRRLAQAARQPLEPSA